MTRSIVVSLLLTACVQMSASQLLASDHVAELQAKAIADGRSELAHWGTDAETYNQWKSHSNRLIPVYTFGTRTAKTGVNLKSYSGVNSPYRREGDVQRLYGMVPERTVNPQAVWMDQTNIADIQRAAAEAGKKYIFLVVFDGMDWHTTRAAAVYNSQAVGYTKGKGAGTHFQEYDAAGTAQFGFMVTSPHNDGTDADVDAQTVLNPGGTSRGGYDADAAGYAPWATPSDPGYLIAKPAEGNIVHAYTDSASSATSMTAGIKTYNNAINVDASGQQVSAIAHELQQQGWSVGAVSSVPISHATPACAYAHNVTRQDYQDISRDMLGLPSIAHPETPLQGLDVVIGGGYGTIKKDGKSQGGNFEPGNIYLADTDLQKVAIANGGQYETAVRTSGKSGPQILQEAAVRAVKGQHRLLGFFGVGDYNGHLPFQTANGDYRPVRGVAKKPEAYTDADLKENPSVAQMATAAIQVLQSRKTNFWLMVEAGDVDWANHDDNIDNSIGAVNSGDAAVKVITDWVEANSSWEESLVIVTADHGHLMVLKKPELLIGD